MGAAWTLGPHRVSFEGPDLVRLVTAGPFDRKLLEDLEALVAELQARYPVLYLISDVRQCTGMTREVRASLAGDVERSRFAGIAIVGASFALRALTATLPLGPPERRPFILVETDAEAKSWVAAWRDADTGVLRAG
jgi:hypothetical protein